MTTLTLTPSRNPATYNAGEPVVFTATTSDSLDDTLTVTGEAVSGLGAVLAPASVTITLKGAVSLAAIDDKGNHWVVRATANPNEFAATPA